MTTKALSIATATKASISVGMQILCLVVVSQYAESALAQAKEWSTEAVTRGKEPDCKPIGSPKKKDVVKYKVEEPPGNKAYDKKPDPDDCKPPKAPHTVFDLRSGK